MVLCPHGIHTVCRSVVLCCVLRTGKYDRHCGSPCLLLWASPGAQLRRCCCALGTGLVLKSIGSFKTDGRVPVPLGLRCSKPVSLSPHPIWLGLSLASGLSSKMRRALCYKLHVSSIFERMYKLFIVCPAARIHSSFTFTHWTAAAKLAGFFVFKDYFMCLGVLLAGISVFYVCEWCIHIGCWIY